MSITSMEDLKNKQAEVKKNLDGYTCRVLVCSGTGCIASGAQKIYEEMSRLCEGIEGVAVEMQKDVPHVGIVKTGCQGLCELGPLMRIEPYDYQYVHVQPEDCKEIVERTILEGKPAPPRPRRPDFVISSITPCGVISKKAFAIAENPPTEIYSSIDSASILPQFSRTILVCWFRNGISLGCGQASSL